jgi:hypothetical protein
MKIGWIFAAWNSGRVHCGNLIAVLWAKIYAAMSTWKFAVMRW